MPTSVALQDLITAVVEAVVAAQTQVEHRQTEILRQYFDQDGRPLSLSLQLPALGAGTSTTEATTLAVPIIAVIPPNLLQISAVSIDFDVELGTLDQPAVPMRAMSLATTSSEGAPLDVPNIEARPAQSGQRLGEAATTAPPPPQKTLTVGLQPAPREPGARASVQLKVESQPQSEGIARLISQISQRF